MECDRYLLEVDANEPCITHRLGMYLQEAFCTWHVDCEYNKDKDGRDFKRIPHRDGNRKRVFPDIIVHRRGCENNLLVIEVKLTTSKSRDDSWDLKKLDRYRRDLQYCHAVFLKLGAKDRTGEAHMCWR